MHIKSFKYRLYPTKAQRTKMNHILDECQILYNHFLSERTLAWERKKEHVSLYDQIGTIPSLKKQRPSLKEVYAQSLQDVATRVDLAFKAFFRRCKSGEKPGYPRRKNDTYDSFRYPQFYPKGCPFQFVENNRIKLAKVGNIKARIDRPIQGMPKNCTVRRTSTGKWFVSISCAVEDQPLPVNKLEVGIDLGLSAFATMSDGSRIANPRFFKKEQAALAKAQRRFEKQKKGSVARRKAKKVVARVHERIRNKRIDFCHQESRKVVNKYGIICVEDLSVNRLLEERKYSKSIADAAWGMFLGFTSYKAESAGRRVVQVDPRNTSQICSNCGEIVKKSLSERIHRCTCGYVEDRDVNAARNILQRALQVS
jgi:putative transposase